MTKKMSEDAQSKLMELQMLQQRFQVFAGQKQELQIKQLEVDNALKEVSKTKKPVYSIVGGIMIERKAKDVKKELTGQKKEIDIKIKKLEKEEKSSQKKVEKLQAEVAKELK